MNISSQKRPWIKATSYGHRQVKDPYYQSPEWKAKVDAVWKRDNSQCQLCKEKGIIHNLTRGTRDINKQGTVDHKTQRKKQGSDEMDNLWLIGSNHHYSKSAQEGNQMK